MDHAGYGIALLARIVAEQGLHLSAEPRIHRVTIEIDGAFGYRQIGKFQEEPLNLGMHVGLLDRLSGRLGKSRGPLLAVTCE